MKKKYITIISSLVFALSSLNQSVNAKTDDSEKKIINLVETSKVPELSSLKNIEGIRFNLNKAFNEKPTILIFYRGGWCPYCNAHFSKIKTVEKELMEIGFQIIAISPDNPEHLRKTIDKHNMNYLLLSDSKMQAAKAFGLDFKVDEVTLFKYKTVGIDLEKASGENHKMLPVPSIFIIDTSGIIKFKYSNPDYKVRIEPDVLLKEAKLIIEKK
jgi:peroxiredoxin